MGSREKTVVFLGLPGAGKNTAIGCMLFKYGAIDMLTMHRFQQEGIRTHDQAAKNLRALGITLTFDTPQHHVTIADFNTVQADCAILVLSAGTLATENSLVTKELFENTSNARQLIILINKMDAVNWSENEFQKILDRLSHRKDNTLIIPISALYGDNVVERSPNSPWYQGWEKNGQSGATVLEALEVSLQSSGLNNP